MIRRFYKRVRASLNDPVVGRLDNQRHSLDQLLQPDTTQKLLQLQLMLAYRRTYQEKQPLPRFDEVGFRVYSQTDEDGLLLYIFALIGTTTRLLIDIGAAGVQGSSTANLLIHHGWQGLLFDGSEQAVSALQAFYAACLDTYLVPPQVIQAFFTAENVNQLLQAHCSGGEIDLLSIDIDGIDWWLWQALDFVKPRVVVVEYQTVLGPEQTLTIPYRTDFQANQHAINREAAPLNIYNSASLAAFVKLGKTKGYRLVGCNRLCYNAFFVRAGLAEDVLPEVSPVSCFQRVGSEGFQARVGRFSTQAAALDWVTV